MLRSIRHPAALTAVRERIAALREKQRSADERAPMN
jgi:hypothetical protein